MDRVLSSGATLLYKLFVPLGILVLLGGLVADTYLHYDTIVVMGKRGGGGPHMWYWTLAIWIVAAAFLWMSFAPLKKVRIEGDHLVVSNFLRTWQVPFSSIAKVRMVASMRPCPIIVELKESAGLGKSVKFLAKGSTARRSMAPYRMVEDLRRLAGLEAPTSR